MKTKTIKHYVLAVIFLATSFAAQAQSLVASQSSVKFTIKNLGIGVDGSFKGLAGTVKFDPKNLASSVFDVTVDASTVDTKNKMRDDHLRKDDYFGVAKYKTIRLKSTKITSKGGNKYNFAGVLTIRDKSYNIGFDFVATPSGTGYVFAGDFKIDRTKFGVGTSTSTLSNLVTVKLNVVSK
jgi:polyisoprenoid-binding protein YceI